MKKDILFSLLPNELWFMIYKIEHGIIYQKVVEEINTRVVFIEIDITTRTFFIAKGENKFSILAVF
tara:strand:- start:2225 stop:2422 length:198 start_codon:yes stop_codon:yes gene_type:complete